MLGLQTSKPEKCAVLTETVVVVRLRKRFARKKMWSKTTRNGVLLKPNLQKT